MEFNTVTVKENILIDNEKKANELRHFLSSNHIFFINVMASPGAGKTTLLVELINSLKKDFNIGVLEADIDGDVDAERVSSLTGVKSMQIHTSGACHLTSQMVEDAIKEFDLSTNYNVIHKDSLDSYKPQKTDYNFQIILVYF